jgi:hypothetical protein
VESSVTLSLNFRLNRKTSSIAGFISVVDPSVPIFPLGRPEMAVLFAVPDSTTK